LRLRLAGTIIAWAGPMKNIPNGWLLCDGREMSTRENMVLFNAIGTRYGGNGSPKYNLPDFQGYFLRGVDNGRGVDPDASDRYKQNHPGVQFKEKDKAGSFQNDEILKHSHNWQGYTRAGQVGGKAIAEHGVDRSSVINTSSFGESTETRPKNANVHWIIKD
jgi:microcystin-dependent protein